MTHTEEQALSAKQSLARLLEFLSRLHQSESIKQSVIKQIEDRVKTYTTKKVDDDFAGSNGYLPDAIRKSSELRTSIIAPGNGKQYKHYNGLFREDDDDDNAKKYTGHLINNIFSLYGCLYYMYYECSEECNYIGGSDWSDNKCNGTGGHGNDLNQWLRDKSGTRNDMIKRGFSDVSLSDNEGESLFDKSSIGGLLYYLQSAQLQLCLYFMLFLPTSTMWNDAQSGHAILFIEAFCEKVSKGQLFKGKSYKDISPDTIKDACSELNNKITALVNSSTIVPVAHNSALKYEDLLEAEFFENYLKWLRMTLPNLITSLQEMQTDIGNWDKEKLKTSLTFGPFPWGFVFKDPNWHTSRDGVRSKLRTPLSALIGALEKLHAQFEKIPAEPLEQNEDIEEDDEQLSRRRRDVDSSSSTTAGSTIGTAIGAAGLGGAIYGASQGLFGPAAEAAVRTLKALFF